MDARLKDVIDAAEAVVADPCQSNLLLLRHALQREPISRLCKTSYAHDNIVSTAPPPRRALPAPE